MLPQLTLYIVHCVLFSGVHGKNVTEAPIAQYGDVCSNECSDRAHDWCGSYRSNSQGKAMRCMQYTIYGRACVLEGCVKQLSSQKSYHFCKTNENKLGGRGTNIWWDYCSLEGFTSNNVSCTDNCEQRGEDYYWCHTSTETSAWDYCSQPGRVKPVQKTIYGSRCISECLTYGESYYWCNRNIQKCDSKNCPPRWDYCSPDEYHTRYNKKCTEPCARRREDYYWCYKDEGGWDYCSPSVPYMDYGSENTILTIYGLKCKSECSKNIVGTYFWCSQYGGSIINWWDYCSPHANLTRYDEKCVDRCTSRGEGYNWCHTGTGWGASWDYCSPEYGPGTYWSYQTPFYENHWFYIGIIVLLILSCLFCKLWSRDGRNSSF